MENMDGVFFIVLFITTFTGFIVEQYSFWLQLIYYDGKDNAIWGWEVVGSRGLYPKSWKQLNGRNTITITNAITNYKNDSSAMTCA